ncbi:MAG: hypothetical protein KGZ84_05175 [Erysipelotrichia bacterium]|nr:hypothetical protein [Erysipelotrichia bacterium]
MTHSIRLSNPVKHVRMLLLTFILSIMTLLAFTSSAHAVLKVPDESSLAKIEDALVEQVHPTIVISSAWIIDFPSVVKLSFYQVVALVGEDQVEKTFFLDMNTYELVDEALIESYREQEADAEDPILTITNTKDLELNEDNSMLWILSGGALVLGAATYLIFKQRKAANH